MLPCCTVAKVILTGFNLNSNGFLIEMLRDDNLHKPACSCQACDVITGGCCAWRESGSESVSTCWSAHAPPSYITANAAYGNHGNTPWHAYTLQEWIGCRSTEPSQSRREARTSPCPQARATVCLPKRPLYPRAITTTNDFTGYRMRTCISLHQTHEHTSLKLYQASKIALSAT